MFMEKKALHKQLLYNVTLNPKISLKNLLEKFTNPSLKTWT